MQKITRRGFLRMTGGAAAFSALSCSIERAVAIDARGTDPDPDAAPARGTIEDIEHVVVLMQENRSFDHYFGALRGVRGFGDPRPVTLPSGKSVWHQPSGATTVLPFRPTANDLGMQLGGGVNHDWAGGHAAFNGGKYDGWIAAKT